MITINKRFVALFAILFSLCSYTHSFAQVQRNVIAKYPEHKEGKLISLEEAVLPYKLIPRFKSGNKKVSDIMEAQNSSTVKIVSKKNNGLSQITVNDEVIIKSDNPNIVYGEIVSRNEFGINEGFFLSPDKSKLAFYKKDESSVSNFPLLDIKSRTGKLIEIKYPMAGMSSEIVDLGVYDFSTKKIIYLKVNEFDKERYLTNITWSPDSKNIYIQVLARSQKSMKLNVYNACSGDFIKTILTEENPKYVEPLDPIWFIDNETFIYRTNNRDGYRNLYLCDKKSNLKRLTVVDADVEYITNDGKWVYYYSCEVSPIERHLFRVNIKNKKRERLSYDTGWHTVKIAEDFSYFIDVYSNVNTTPIKYKCSIDGKNRTLLEVCENPVKDYAFCEIELGTVPSACGKYQNAYRMIKPANFDKSGKTKYPVILYVYGGPHSQMVNNSWLANLRYWEMYMANRGYLVYVQDNRGTQYQGLDYEQAIWSQCGQEEMKDQMVGVNMLKSLPYVDTERIGVHGWSYGGFMTISLMTNYPETFKVGVAGGPVIDWKWYEVMYGERYMDTPENNPEGYKKTSLMNMATALKGRLLICQGAVDMTVLWQHSLSFIQECVSNHVRVDYFPYPIAEHNVIGKDRIHLMDKVSLYFDDYL